MSRTPGKQPAGATASSPSCILHLRAEVDAQYGQLPLAFEVNRGQSAARVNYLSRGPGYTLFVTQQGPVLALKSSARGPKPEGRNAAPRIPAVVRMRLVGTNARPQAMGLEELPGKSNYFIGNLRSRWITNVPTYSKVRYAGVYPGVDLIYYGKQGQLEYDFVVAPGADPSAIQFAVLANDPAGGWHNAAGRKKPGQSSIVNRQSSMTAPLRIDGNGDLVVRLEDSEVRFHKPVAYQVAGTPDNPKSKIRNRKYLACRYVLRGRRVSFNIGDYDRTRPLLIDPVLTYSTYLGGSAADAALGIAVDSSGNAYVTGFTQSTNFPTATPEQKANGGASDAFVAKLNSGGTALVYSTYLGGSGADQGTGIAVDSSGNAFVTGSTTSPNFPTTTGVFQSTYGGNSDAFVTKLNSSGSSLVYSSYLGGIGADFGQGIAIDGSGNAYITGSTQSPNFPTAGSPFQSKSSGQSDAFVAKVGSSGASLTYSTYLGGSAADTGQAIAVDASGNAYVTGTTFSTNFPTAAPAQPANAGSSDAFVTKLNSAGSGLVYSTYLGGEALDRGLAIALDSQGSAYVTGDTQSVHFPATPGVFQAINNGHDNAFVAKLNPGGALAYSTYLGGESADQGNGIAVDAGLNAYVTGSTQSTHFPLADPFQPALGGGTCGAGSCSDAFVAKLNAQGSALAYSTYLGGSGADVGEAIALDASSNAYVAGSAASANFPITSGPAQAVYGGTGTNGDAFVAKIAPGDAPGIAFAPAALTFASQGTGSTSAPQTVTVTNVGTVTLEITGISASGDFAETNTCSSPLTSGGTCTISVTFKPTTTGNRTGSVSITDNASGSPQQIALTGTGATPAPAVSLSVTSLYFDTPPNSTGTVVGSANPVVLRFTLTNTGSANLNITSIASSLSDYKQSNDCGAAQPAGGSCTIAVTFTPSATGTRSGAISITDNATGSPQTVTLTGTGLAQFSLSSPASSSTVNIGASSTTFTVAAAGPASFSSSISLSCTFANTLLSAPTCAFNPTTIKVGQSTTLTVSSFSISPPNPLSFSVTGSAGSTNAQQSASVALYVIFRDFSLSAVGPDGVHTLAAVTAGQTATYALAITPLNGLQQPISLACSFASPTAGTSCSVTPASVTPNGVTPSSASVKVSTTAHAASGPRAVPPPPPPSIWLALAALVFLLGVRLTWSGQRYDSRPAWIVLVAVLALLLTWAGCNNYGSLGAFSEFGGVAQKGTPTGNYSIMISGTVGTGSNAVTRSTSVNLSVQ